MLDMNEKRELYGLGSDHVDGETAAIVLVDRRGYIVGTFIYVLKTKHIVAGRCKKEDVNFQYMVEDTKERFPTIVNNDQWITISLQEWMDMYSVLKLSEISLCYIFYDEPISLLDLELSETDQIM